LAYLDKIIDDCENETNKNLPKLVDKQLDNFIVNINDQIKEDDLKV
jgi:hypothetical protein